MFKPELSLSPSGMPFLTNQNIDSIGEQMAVDFDKAILLNPHELDIDRFVERYLKMAVDFMYLSHCGVYLGTFFKQQIGCLYTCRRRTARIMHMWMLELS